MPKLSVYNISGQATGEEIELNDLVFGVEFNEAVVHQAIVMQQAAERQGTSATKTRGWVGGGTTFGPQPRSYAKKMPRKARRLAIRCALSAKVAAGELIVVEGLSFDAPKTKNVVTMLSAFDAADKKALLITDGSNENVELSSRNIPKVTALSNGCLNCFDLLHNNKVFLAKDAVAKIEEVLA